MGIVWHKLLKGFKDKPDYEEQISMISNNSYLKSHMTFLWTKFQFS